MMEYIDVLRATGLFNGIDDAGLQAMLTCLGAKIEKKDREEAVIRAGEKPSHIGVNLSGRLHIIKEDYDGNRSIVAAVMPGGIFAEAPCCAGITESPVTVLAAEPSYVMLLQYSKIPKTCPNACTFHATLIGNLLGLIAQKNIYLQGRMDIVGVKSVRAKILRFFDSYTLRHGQAITIPYNREQLADYLNVERSALSHELSRMKQDGLIDYKKNMFVRKW